MAVEGADWLHSNGPSRTLLDDLISWTELSDPHERFSGTARYETTFERPPGENWWLNLGTVHDSASVWLNGKRLGTSIDTPYRFPIETLERTNSLRIEVTNRAANRIRDLDRRDVDWKRFEEINFVGCDYEPFDATEWDARPAGLLGPVQLVFSEPLRPHQ